MGGVGGKGGGRKRDTTGNGEGSGCHPILVALRTGSCRSHGASWLVINRHRGFTQRSGSLLMVTWPGQGYRESPTKDPGGSLWDLGGIKVSVRIPEHLLASWSSWMLLEECMKDPPEILEDPCEIYAGFKSLRGSLSILERPEGSLTILDHTPSSKRDPERSL